jgi:membrane protein
MVFGTDAARNQLVTQVQIYSRSQVIADIVQSMVDNAHQPGTSLTAAIIGMIALLYGGTAVFNELKHSMNVIWDVPEPTVGGGLRHAVGSQLFSLVMVAVSGLVLAASLILGTLLTAMQHWMNVLAPGLPFGNELVNFLLFLVASIPVFMLMYKYIPDIYITWRDVTIGAIATALLFSAGRYLISLYLVRSSATTPYGAAASLAVLLLWAYYSAQVFFLGAEFTQVYARTFGSHHIVNEDPVRQYPAQVEPRAVSQPVTRRRLRR